MLVSIKPEFANRIFDGSKKIELRKSSPNVNPGDLMIVYSTFPEMAVIGVCKIDTIIKSSPKEIWTNYSELLGIDKERFFDYYSDYNTAIGIVLKSAKRFKEIIPLKKIKENYPSFSPPQTFRYLERDMISMPV